MNENFFDRKSEVVTLNDTYAKGKKVKPLKRERERERQIVKISAHNHQTKRKKKLT